MHVVHKQLQHYNIIMYGAFENASHRVANYIGHLFRGEEGQSHGGQHHDGALHGHEEEAAPQQLRQHRAGRLAARLAIQHSAEVHNKAYNCELYGQM